MSDFLIPDNPEYSVEMRKLEVTDPAHADLFNAMFAQLLENDAYFKTQVDQVKKDLEDMAGGEEIREIIQEQIGQVQDQIGEVQQQLQNQIDTKADKSILLSVTIPSTAWTGDAAPYTAQVAVEELTGSEQELIEVFVQYEASFEQKTAWAEAGIASGDNIQGAIILEALGEKPGVDIPIHILKRGDLGDNTSGAACDCVPLTEQQIDAIVSGTYNPGEEEPAACGCVPLTAGEIIDIVEG